MVHPGGWRNVDGVFKETQNLLKSKKVMYLKLHTFRQGQEYFDAAINFDYYILKNELNIGFITEISNVRNEIERIDISKAEFISDENIVEIQSLVAKEGQEKVNILNNSMYHHQRDFMSSENIGNFIYPVVYTVKSPDKGNIARFWYSSRNDRGHYKISKIIWGTGATGIIIDQNGDYAIS